ncbi:MAG: DUF3363 domain-containing protein [Mesorhizobium sp.]|nr:MAG: DUF3363 domain-containing protein [Mesorhizobium sp.]
MAIAGKKHVAVRKACLGVLEGLKETRDARKAFVEAAKEADTLRALGERDDIIKHMHRSLVGHGIDRPVAGYVLAAEEIDTPVIGRLLQRAHPNRRHYAVCARPMD